MKYQCQQQSALLCHPEALRDYRSMCCHAVTVALMGTSGFTNTSGCHRRVTVHLPCKDSGNLGVLNRIQASGTIPQIQLIFKYCLSCLCRCYWLPCGTLSPLKRALWSAISRVPKFRCWYVAICCPSAGVYMPSNFSPEYRLYTACYGVLAGKRFFIVTNTFVEKCRSEIMQSACSTGASGEGQPSHKPGSFVVITWIDDDACIVSG